MDLNKFRLPYREDTAFGLLVFCIFVVPIAFSLFSYENFESVKLSLFLIFTGLAAAVFFLKQPKDAVFKFQKKFFLFLSFFGIWALISSFLATDRLYSFIGFYYRYTSGFLFYLVLLLFIWLLINTLDQDRFEYILKVLLVSGLAVAVISYLQSFGWIFYAGLSVDGFDRGPSLLGNSNYSAMFLAVVFPFAIYFIIKSKTFAARIYYAFCAFMFVFACLLLASRGALLALFIEFFIAISLLLIKKFPKKYLWSLLIGAALIIFLGNFLLSVSRPNAISSVVVSADANTLSRFYSWEVSFKEIAGHPWFGSGLGNFALFFERARRGELAGSAGIFDDAHNLFIHLAATGGIPLLIFFAGMLLLGWYFGFRQLNKTQNYLYIALLSSLVAWVVAVCFNPVPIPMYLLLGVILSGLVLGTITEIKISFREYKKYGLVFLATVIIILGIDSLVSEHLLGLAKSAYLNSDYQQSYTLAGLSYMINPTNNMSLAYKISNEISLSKPNIQVENDINKFIAIHPSQANTYVGASNLFALLYSQTHKKMYLAAAITQMEQSLKIDPFFSDRYGQLAMYYYQIGNNERAKINAEKNVSLDDSSFSSWVLIAKLYQLEGNKRATIFALTKAFNLNPNLVQLKYLLNLAKKASDIKQVPIQISSQVPGF